jgi:hypothetical protein
MTAARAETTLPNEVKHLGLLIEYASGLHQRCSMLNGDPAKGTLVIEARDGKATKMLVDALVFLQAHMPTIEHALEKDEAYYSKKKAGGGRK